MNPLIQQTTSSGRLVGFIKEIGESIPRSMKKIRDSSKRPIETSKSSTNFNEDVLLNFNEVLEQASKPHLLLGNGFSMAYDHERFSFTTLLESAVAKGIMKADDKLYRIFGKLATADFERVMRSLEDAKGIIEIYEGDPALRKKLVDDGSVLKEHLVKIVTNNHPEKSTSLTVEEKTTCVNFLKNFNKIYTLNYDLLLYWATMQDTEVENFTDGFGNTEDSIHEGYVVYKNSGSQAMNVHYLHGALHYFDAGDEIIKKTYVNTDICLIDQITESLNKNIYPVFISEGTSEQKKTKILHSAYLNHCYKSLRSIGGDIVIFGTTLKENDKHILDALLESKVKNIYLGVSKSSAADHIKHAMEVHNQNPDQKHQKNLYLYDYKTVNVWGR